jgi:hypothetical protein
VAEVNSVEAWQAAVQDPAFPRELPGKPNPSLYETVREEDAFTAQPGAVLINPFEVPDSEGDAFLAAWEAARDAMVGAEGYLGTRLYRSLAPNTRFRFVNVTRWRSPRTSRRRCSGPNSNRRLRRCAIESTPRCTR